MLTAVSTVTQAFWLSFVIMVVHVHTDASLPNTDCSCSKVRQPSSKLRLSAIQHQTAVLLHAKDAGAVIFTSC